jgi:hypothetical protein
MKSIRICVILIIVLSFRAPAAIGDIISLKNGRTIQTGPTWEENGNLYFQKYGQTVGIPLSDVESVVEEEKTEEEDGVSRKIEQNKTGVNANRGKRIRKGTPIPSEISTEAFKNLFSEPNFDNEMDDTEQRPNAAVLDEEYIELVQAKTELLFEKHILNAAEYRTKLIEFRREKWRFLDKARRYHRHQVSE